MRDTTLNSIDTPITQSERGGRDEGWGTQLRRSFPDLARFLFAFQLPILSLLYLSYTLGYINSFFVRLSFAPGVEISRCSFFAAAFSNPELLCLWDTCLIFIGGNRFCFLVFLKSWLAFHLIVAGNKEISWCLVENR